MEKFPGPRGLVCEMYRASVCMVKVCLSVICGEQGVLRDRMVTYESSFIVDYDGGGDKIKIKHLKNIASNKTHSTLLTASCKIKWVHYCSGN
jgi:hypothetical protein